MALVERYEIESVLEEHDFFEGEPGVWDNDNPDNEKHIVVIINPGEEVGKVDVGEYTGVRRYTYLEFMTEKPI